LRTLAVGYAVAPSPFGPAFVAATPRGVCALWLLTDEDPAPALARLCTRLPGASPAPDPSLAGVVDRALAHVIDGEPCDDIALDLRGTPFQLRVWDALRAIPRGETTTYGAIAEGLGLARVAARAVGAACGANPVGLIVPCHRVVAAGGGLGGYYWGLDRKQALLEWERGVAAAR
jgi:O-6-methylguanine DNA methyltransferase